MSALDIYKFKSFFLYILLGFLSLISTLTNFGILLLINIAISGKNAGFWGAYNWLAFLALTLISFASTVFFQNKLTILTNNKVFDLENSIIQKVRVSSFESFGKMGKEKIYAVIADAEALGRVPEALISFINAFIAIICALIYLFTVSMYCSLTIIMVMLALFFTYMVRNKNIMRDLNQVRDAQDRYYFFLRELIDGFKQIKISRKRNDNLYNNYILANRNLSKELTIASSKKYILNQSIGGYSWYLLLGIIVFVLPLIFKLSTVQVTAFITTILFIMGPVSALVNVIPFFSRVKISYERINNLDNLLKWNTAATSEVKRIDFESIRFENVRYNYNDGTPSFSFELKKLSISKGETVFIVGNNGSGKTTFINLLTGLYKPSSGKVFVNNEVANWDDFGVFCNNMAVIFTDHYLFSQNYDEIDFHSTKSEIDHFSQLLNMDDFLIIDRDNNINTKLSKGQQKRVALLLALMEDKPIIVLDEWAAEQDSYNRKCFYTRWLEEMKLMGKTVIVISHDQENLQKAERIVRFNDGKIISDIKENFQNA